MSATVNPPVRRGAPTTMTLDYEAEALLRGMVPNSKALGLFVSELIRKEFDCRAERVRLLSAVRESGHV